MSHEEEDTCQDTWLSYKRSEFFLTKLNCSKLNLTKLNCSCLNVTKRSELFLNPSH